MKSRFDHLFLKRNLLLIVHVFKKTHFFHFVQFISHFVVKLSFKLSNMNERLYINEECMKKAIFSLKKL